MIFVRISRVLVNDRSDVYRGGGVVVSPPRQHRAADGVEQGCHDTLLGLRLYGGLGLSQ